MPTARTTLPLLALLALVSCATDQALAAPSSCGDSKLDPEEECDVDGPGCVACREQPGFRCRDNVCAAVCGDGAVVSTEECDPPDGATCDSSCRLLVKAKLPCDLTGHWMLQQVDFSYASLGIKALQVSSNWFYWRVEQEGDRFEVKDALFCGTEVSGAVKVRLPDYAVRALMHRNRQDARSPFGARTGELRLDGDACVLSTSRHYFIRGGKDSLLPADFSTKPALEALPPLPAVVSPYDLEEGGDVSAAIDPDGDGLLGIPYVVTGIVNGTRNVVQRDWSEYATDDELTIAPFATEFVARSDFDSEEHILQLVCDGASKCPLLETGSEPAADKKGKVRFRYLGASLDDARVREVVKGTPGKDEGVDLETCRAIQAAMPHDPRAK